MSSVNSAQNPLEKHETLFSKNKKIKSKKRETPDTGHRLSIQTGTEFVNYFYNHQQASYADFRTNVTLKNQNTFPFNIHKSKLSHERQYKMIIFHHQFGQIV